SDDLAKSQGIKIKKQNFIYLLSIAAMVALGVKIVGSLLVGALVIIPAATSRNLSKNLKEYSLGSVVLGILSCFFGSLLFKLTGLPAGPLIILTSTFFFLISLIFKR
ncbi:MAG: ABC transporter, partial [Candidatus Nealsonbacteria bacterium CG02_land_8_20_14_3_00_37_10]